MVPPIDSSPPPEALRPKPKTPDLKTKTPEQSKQQKVSESQPTSSACAEIPMGLDIDQLIERTDTVLGPALVGLDPSDQSAVDSSLQ